MLWPVCLGIPLGVISALKQNTIIDYVTMVFVNLGYAIPNFLICTLLIYLLRGQVGRHHRLPDKRDRVRLEVLDPAGDRTRATHR